MPNLPAVPVAAPRHPGTTNGKPTGTTGPEFQSLVSRAYDHLAEVEVYWSPAKVSREVRRFIRAAAETGPSQDRLDERGFETWLNACGVVDTTATRAVNRVLRQRGGAA